MHRGLFILHVYLSEGCSSVGSLKLQFRKEISMVTLNKIESNYDVIVKLHVSEAQKHFVASNDYSLAQAKEDSSLIPMGVYKDSIPVGFVMHGFDKEAGEYWICRLMIDEKHQGKGCGRRAMELVIEEIKKDNNLIYISFEPENDGAKKLYESLGFVPDNRVLEGETVYRLEL